MEMLRECYLLHLKHCPAIVCEIGMNQAIVTKLETIVSEMYSLIINTDKTTSTPDSIKIATEFTGKLSLLVKTLLQSCSDRPVEYTDVNFMKYLVNKVYAFEQLKKAYQEQLTDCGVSLVATKKTKGKAK